VKGEANASGHITKGDVLDDLGVARSEASAPKVKATLLGAILRREIENRGYTQRQLVETLDEYQPSVSNLIPGKIAKASVEKLLTHSDRLQMKTNAHGARSLRNAARFTNSFRFLVRVCEVARGREMFVGTLRQFAEGGDGVRQGKRATSIAAGGPAAFTWGIRVLIR
jgi:predicted XRE-type DNA-binding protein